MAANMREALPVFIMKPERQTRQREAAWKLLAGIRPAVDAPEPESPAQLKEELQRVRREARDHLAEHLRQLLATLDANYPGLQVRLARNAADAVAYITAVAQEERTLITNNSSVVNQELKPGLARNGFCVLNSYAPDFHATEKRFRDYYDLPNLAEKNLSPSFEVSLRFAGLPPGKSRKCLAVLGVNAIAAEDGTAFFMEHLTNIQQVLRDAHKVVLVAGLDKIVRTSQEARLQTLCTGVFGLESILLGIGPRAGQTSALDDLLLAAADKPRELHLILLDNGRRDILGGAFADLFLCIGCRACNKHCPIRHAFAGAGYPWTPVNYLKEFLSRRGEAVQVDACLHCEACTLECPVSIDLHYLMWLAAYETFPTPGPSLPRALLGRPEMLARFGCGMAPLSNWMLEHQLVRVPLEAVAGVARRASLPRFHARTFKERIRGRVDCPKGRKAGDAGSREKKVAFFHGCFANYYDPPLGEATLDVLHRNGVEVIVPDQACCGLPMMAKGNTSLAVENMKFNTRVLADLVSQGYALTTTCPSCGLFLKRYYPKRLGSEQARQVSENLLHITEYLLRLDRAGQLNTDFAPLSGSVFYHTPCHLRAQLHEQQAGNYTLELLRKIPGVNIMEVSEACCGMAGTYGLQKAHYELSQAITAELRQRVAATPSDRVVDDCGACRIQIEGGTGRKVDHPVKLLQEAYGIGRSQDNDLRRTDPWGPGKSVTPEV